MPLPYSHKKKQDINSEKLLAQNPSYIANLFASELQKSELSNLEISGNTVQLTYKNSLFKIAYDFKVAVIENENSKQIISTIYLDNLLKFSIVAAILPAFFTFLEFSKFLFYSPLFFVGFYSFNLLLVRLFLNAKINTILGENQFNFKGSEELNALQEEWQNNPGKCSACGENLLEIDYTCPECGINLKRNRFSVPLNVSKYEEKTVRYFYKDKKIKP